MPYEIKDYVWCYVIESTENAVRVFDKKEEAQIVAKEINAAILKRAHAIRDGEKVPWQMGEEVEQIYERNSEYWHGNI